MKHKNNQILEMLFFPEGKFWKSGSVGWWYEQNRRNKGRLSKKADLRGLGTGGGDKRGCPPPPSLPSPIWSQRLAEKNQEGGKAFFAGRGCAGKICGWDKGGEVQRLTDELVLAISPVKCFVFWGFFSPNPGQSSVSLEEPCVCPDMSVFLYQKWNSAVGVL